MKIQLGQAQVAPGKCRHLASDTHHGQPVGAIGGDGQLQNSVVESQQWRHRRAG